MQKEVMTRDKLFKLHGALSSEALELMKKKNHDYAGKKGDDPFRNFRFSEDFDVHPARGVLLRMMDKMQRLNTFINTGDLKNESAKDSIVDIINYSVLLAGILEVE